MKKLARIFAILMALIIASPANALVPSDEILDMYNKNGIYYYNPVGNADNCNNSSTTLSGSDTAEKIWNFFIQQGFNDAQTAGLLGNGMAESGLGPTRASNSSFWGLFQWGGGRRVALQNKISLANIGLPAPTKTSLRQILTKFSKLSSSTLCPRKTSTGKTKSKKPTIPKKLPKSF